MVGSLRLARPRVRAAQMLLMYSIDISCNFLVPRLELRAYFAPLPLSSRVFELLFFVFVSDSYDTRPFKSRVVSSFIVLTFFQGVRIPHVSGSSFLLSTPPSTHSLHLFPDN